MTEDHTSAIAIVPMPEDREKLRKLVDTVLDDELPRLWRGSRIDGSPFHALVDWLLATPRQNSRRQAVLEHIEYVIVTAIREASKGASENPRIEIALRIVDSTGDEALAQLTESLIPQAARLAPGVLEALIRVQRIRFKNPAERLDFFLNLFPSPLIKTKMAGVGFQLLRLAVETGDYERILRTQETVSGWCNTPDEKKGWSRLTERLGEEIEAARKAFERHVVHAASLRVRKEYANMMGISYAEMVLLRHILLVCMHIFSTRKESPSAPFLAFRKHADEYEVARKNSRSPFFCSQITSYDYKKKSIVYSIDDCCGLNIDSDETLWKIVSFDFIKPLRAYPFVLPLHSSRENREEDYKDARFTGERIEFKYGD